MRFTEILVENIFAYSGQSVIDLTGCTDEKNIIVVRGRNGAGKTSLLNAIKLLFLGTADLQMRRVGFGESPLNPKHYVLGQPGRWYGVINTGARAQTNAAARVALTWEEDGRKVVAERSFRANHNGTDFTEQIQVVDDGRTLPQEDALAKLQRLLPREVTPFFFFDGEQIQSLADADIGRESAEIERLLGLSFVGDLSQQLDTYIKERRRAGFPDEVRARIVKAENVQRAAEAAAEAATRARIQLEEEILDLERQRDRVELERSRLRGGISDEDRRRMEGRISVLAYQREQLANEIVALLPVEAPALVNLALAGKIFGLLDAQLNGGADATLATRLHREVGREVVAGASTLVPPLVLTDDQQRQVLDLVRAALQRAGVPLGAHADPLLGSLSPRQLARLRDQFYLWAAEGAAKAGSQAHLLRQMRQNRAESAQAQRELDEAELTTEDARLRYEQLTIEFNEHDRAIRERVETIAGHRLEEQRARREMQLAADEIAKLEQEHEAVTRENESYQFAVRTRRALNDYRERRRQQIRASVEHRLNEKVGILLGPTLLIKSARLDDRFVMTYFDDNDEEVARHSISAGMRQLVAMAMLWALKEEAQRPLPVVIDTPMGRIDAANRTILMTEYFPAAGNPLILLPTDTEFGEQGYSQIGHRIRRSYTIQNSGRGEAKIEASAPAATAGG